METKNKVKYIICGTILVLICALVFAGVLIAGDLKQKNVYGKTYYAALSKMYEKLTTTEGKKIVVIGNSSIPFGVDSALLESLLNYYGYDYSVCNFGLYGSIGTRAMLDLAEEYINEGDIVLFMPEHENQSQSLYFSATELWYCSEENKDLIKGLEKELREEMIANYPSYVTGRIETADVVEPRDIYALSSFDENMDLKLYDRSYNRMELGYDSNSPVNLDALVLPADYFDYVNTFYENISKKGATMYYMYGPLNKSAVSGDIESYCDRIKSGLQCPILGDFADSIMDSEWFYDSNFHLNSSGMAVFTVLILNNLKTCWGDTSVTEYTLPEKPGIVVDIVDRDYDNSDVAYFLYEEYKDGYRVSGLTAEGQIRSRLIVPGSHNGKPIYGINVTTFSGAANLTEAVIQENIKSLADYMFEGCIALQKVTLCHTNPSDISVGYNLLPNATAKIYVPEESKNAYKNNYFWGTYAGAIEGYEE